MCSRFKRNTGPHFPAYNSTGRDVVMIIHDDDKEKHDSELLKQIQPLLTGLLLVGVDLRPQWALKSFKNNSFREKVQYCTMTNFASRFHEEVQNIKIEVAKMSSRPSQLTAVEQLLLIAKVNSHSKICLTVRGFMNITKNFVFHL
ncbi:hypothetical protein TNCT_342531 [Trichonephila clavata]|uniref:Uncharacterized protein n=1 Tax=Trichonephila clavata TaxID=2740835 RepID=A0A8X6GF17_TRICU|nr:hypothetical protein TNCT_342531 [Trichonephila clavata]